MAFATTEDVATRLGRELTEIEGGTVEYLLDTATELILQALGYLAEPPLWVSGYAELPPAEAAPAAVNGVCTEVVCRAFQNPEAAAAMAAGDLSVTYREHLRDSLQLTRHERSTVRRTVGGSSFSSVTLDSGYGGTYVDPELAEIMNGIDP